MITLRDDGRFREFKGLQNAISRSLS